MNKLKFLLFLVLGLSILAACSEDSTQLAKDIEGKSKEVSSTEKASSGDKKETGDDEGASKESADSEKNESSSSGSKSNTDSKIEENKGDSSTTREKSEDDRNNSSSDKTSENGETSENASTSVSKDSPDEEGKTSGSDSKSSDKTNVNGTPRSEKEIKEAKVYTFKEVKGTAVDVIVGLTAVDIDVTNIPGSDKGSTVYMIADGETIDLEYDEENKAFRNIQIKGVKKEALEKAKVYVTS